MLAHVLSAVFLALGTVLLVVNHRRLLRMNPIYLALVFLLLSLGIGQHSQGHAAMDAVYGYRPTLCRSP